MATRGKPRLGKEIAASLADSFLLRNV